MNNSNSSNSSEVWTKIEVDVDNDSMSKRDRVYWNSENTMKLIEMFEKECKELWDTKHPSNKDRAARQAKHEYLAGIFNTTAEEISRKLHNLRTQFNNELRKIKRRQSCGDGGPGSSGWEYFDALSFLMRQPIVDPLDAIEGVNLALAEFQADEEIEFAARARMAAASTPGSSSPPKSRKPLMRVAASASLPSSAHPLLWSEDPLHPGTATDECQVFGDFVASELRSFKSEDFRRRLKRIIQKAILDIGEEEDRLRFHHFKE